MGLFQKLAGSFSIKWEFAKMGLSQVSTARFAKNGIPLYRETPVDYTPKSDVPQRLSQSLNNYDNWFTFQTGQDPKMIHFGTFSLAIIARETKVFCDHFGTIF